MHDHGVPDGWCSGRCRAFGRSEGTLVFSGGEPPIFWPGSAPGLELRMHSDETSSSRPRHTTRASISLIRSIERRTEREDATI